MAGKQKKPLKEMITDIQVSVTEMHDHAAVISSVVRNSESGKVLLADERASLLRLAKWLDVHTRAALATLQEIAERMPDDSAEMEMTDTVVLENHAATISVSENPESQG